MSIEKVVYVSHEFGGKQENADKVATLVTELSNLYPTICFISPIHAFGFMYESTDYDRGMLYCLTLLDMCDEMWVFGEFSNSKGCLIEKSIVGNTKFLLWKRGD